MSGDEDGDAEMDGGGSENESKGEDEDADGVVEANGQGERGREGETDDEVDEDDMDMFSLLPNPDRRPPTPRNDENDGDRLRVDVNNGSRDESRDNGDMNRSQNVADFVEEDIDLPLPEEQPQTPNEDNGEDDAGLGSAAAKGKRSAQEVKVASSQSLSDLPAAGADDSSSTSRPKQKPQCDFGMSLALHQICYILAIIPGASNPRPLDRLHQRPKILASHAHKIRMMEVLLQPHHCRPFVSQYSAATASRASRRTTKSAPEVNQTLEELLSILKY